MYTLMQFEFIYVGNQALLPTPPSIQMPVPMPAVPPQFMVCNLFFIFCILYVVVKFIVYYTFVDKKVAVRM